MYIIIYFLPKEMWGKTAFAYIIITAFIIFPNNIVIMP